MMKTKEGQIYISNDKVYISKDAEPYYESTMVRYQKMKMRKAIFKLKSIINETDK